MKSNKVFSNEFNTNNFENVNPIDLLKIGISSIQLFVQENFIGPLNNANEQFKELSINKILTENDGRKMLEIDGEEINVNVKNCQLLVLSKIIFEYLLKIDYQPIIVQWWYLRYLYIHQQCLDELTNYLYSEYFKYSNIILTEHFNELETINLKVLLMLELIQGYLSYRRIWKAEEYVNSLKKLLSSDVHVEGKLLFK